jgi:hypothetical protein
VHTKKEADYDENENQLEEEETREDRLQYTD